MAIVKMKRVGFVGPLDAREPLLDALQDVALLDPVALTEVDEPPSELVARKIVVQRVITALQTRRKEMKKDAPEPAERTDRTAAEDVVARAETLLARRNELDNRLSILTKEREQIAPWGEFDPADLEILAGKDVHLGLYRATADEVEGFDRSAVDWSMEIDLADARGKAIGLVTVRLGAALNLPLEPALLPSRSLSAIDKEIGEARQEIESGQRALGQLGAELPSVQALERHIGDQLRHAEVKSGLGGDQELFSLSGWCPAEDVDEMKGSLRELPVAVLVEEPVEGEDVPIKLRNPFFVRNFQPLLKAFNLPSYDEYDPTLFIAPFMGLFFGFCLGDFGYGLVLTIIGATALMKFRPEGEIKLAVQWLVILGVCTMIVGALIGNFFGIPVYTKFGGLNEDMLLFRLNSDPKLFFYTALGFGVVQLTIGMLIKLVRQIQLERWQNVIGQLGWLSVFPAIGVWVVMGTPWAFLASLVVILLFASPSPSMVRRLGGGAWALYNITGLVGDVMSYARIFGLGLSSGIIAMVVNTIAMAIVDGIPIVGWPIAILVLLGGHTFNFVMAMIGSVVHPARLQFLEFFGKFFEGGGRAYAPFQKLEGE
jgi:V/A-type H+/Na+-transporting ATPase subunit I